MTPQELAARLHGRTIGEEITTAEAAEAKAAGLVVVTDPSNTLEWLGTHCRAIGMTKRSDSGLLAHDIALFTIDLQNSARIRAAEFDSRLQRFEYVLSEYMQGNLSRDHVDAARAALYAAAPQPGESAQRRPDVRGGDPVYRVTDAGQDALVGRPKTPNVADKRGSAVLRADSA